MKLRYPIDYYFLLAQCLSLDFVGNHKQTVIDTFKTNTVDIQKFVRMADNHLILQTLYPGLEKHELLGYVPPELSEYLKKIYDLNSKRNNEISDQIKTLNTILAKEGIVPMYLKGAGNMLDGLYKNPGERILHDIDFLVEETDFFKSAEILLSKGYYLKNSSPPGNIKYLKHYPLLFSDDYPASVEIHRLPVRKEFVKVFSPDMVLREAIRSADGSGSLVMSDEHKAIHIFLHSQLENSGHLYAKASLRDLYDLLLLSGRANLEEVFFNYGHYHRKAAGLLDILYRSFDCHPQKRIIPGLFFHFYAFRYGLNLRFRFVRIISSLLIRMYISYIKKPFLAISNKEIRLSLFRKLKDRKWWGKHFRRYIK